MPFHKNILRNFTSLGLLQLTNYLVPIVIIPILLGRIGLENYGLVILAQGIMNIFMSVADFGMNMTGTRVISASANVSERRLIAFKILTIKSVLAVVSFFVLAGLTYLIPTWQENQFLILSSYFMVIGNVLLPTWYFQGIQNMKWLPILHLLSRLSYVVCIFLFVLGESDYVLVNVFNGGSTMIFSFVGLFVVFRSLGYRLSLCGIDEIWSFAASNINIFLSVATGTLYRNASIIIAGFFLNGYWLGIYGVVDKIIILITNSYSMLFRAIYPTLCQVIQDRKASVTSFTYTTFGRLFLVILPFLLIFFFFGADLLQLLSREIEISQIQPLIVFITAIPIMLFINLPISLLIVSFNMQKEYLLFSGSALVVLLILSPILVQSFMVKGLISGLIGAELVMMLIGLFFLNRRFALADRVRIQ